VLLPDNAGRTLIADKGYDAMQRVVAPALRAGKTVIISTIRHDRQQRNFD
jgi:predicted kinase